MCPRTCALGLSSSLLSENKKKTTKVCEIGDRESYFGALFILWIHGKNSHIRTTCKLGGHDLTPKNNKKLIQISAQISLLIRQIARARKRTTSGGHLRLSTRGVAIKGPNMMTNDAVKFGPVGDSVHISQSGDL